MRKADAARVLDVLVAAPLFRGLPARRLHQLLQASRLERFAPGQPILRAGDPGDAFYVLIHGAAAVVAPLPAGAVTTLAQLGPGDFFGETALLTGQPRTADVIALETTEALRVPRARFAASLLADPWFKTRLTELSRERQEALLRQRVVQTLQGVPVFAALGWEALARVASSARLVTLERGAYICRQGDAPTALYVLLSGEVEVRVADQQGERVVATLAAGASFGEMSLLTGEPVSATLVVRLDCTLLLLDRPQFQALLEQAPFARNLGQILSQRLRAQTAQAGVRGAPQRAIIVVASEAPAMGKTALAVRLAASLAQRVGPVVLLDLDPARAACRGLGLNAQELHPYQEAVPNDLREGANAVAGLALRCDQAPPSRLHLARLLGLLKQRYRWVVVDTHHQVPEATAHAAALADAVVFLLRNGPLPPAAAAAAERLLVYPPGTRPPLAPPQLASQLFSLPAPGPAPVEPSAALRSQSEGAAQDPLRRLADRLARHLLHQRVGLVLAGGPAWSPYQAGVLAGLAAQGVDIDGIAATGPGSLLGAAYAAGHPLATLVRLAFAFPAPWGPRGRTWPLPRRAATRLLHQLFGALDLATLSPPLWIGTVDAATGAPVTLRTGPVVPALEASLGLRRRPARTAPCLLDGSVIDPVPIRLAQEMGADVVVAVAVAGAPLALRRAGPHPPRPPFASRSLYLATQHLARLGAASADLVIAPPASSPIGRLSQARYAQARAAGIAAATRIAALQAARAAGLSPQAE
ncbi:MAG TPA: cyclic nucleotide-binding domain-containing protein [Chloroflexota bacterium]|nr:cyclic nucleotide-binding domain-containing protein [Chloroflexota bacterium]HZU07871.1 cyclic nucleotide-binding domain-containing protein [Chloroflexota bacterium]